MSNNWFDIEIITTTRKKWNLSVLIIFPILLLFSFFVNSKLFYILFIIWAVIAWIFLLYDYFHSNSIVNLSTKILFKDDSFSIITDDNEINLQIKKEDVTNIEFDKKNNHIKILKEDKILYEFDVKPKTLDELIDTFGCFGYKCDITSYI